MFKRKFFTLLVALLMIIFGMSPAAYATDTNWQWPVKGAVINGYKLDSYYEAGQHRGIDIQTEDGDDVFAPADGVVKSVGSAFGKGMYITIDHGEMLSTYNGLDKVQVIKNAEIKAGEPIAKINSKGFHENLGTPHLHFAIYYESSGSQRRYIDPAQFLPLQEPHQDQTDTQETKQSPVIASESHVTVDSSQSSNESMHNDPAHSSENINEPEQSKNHSAIMLSADKIFSRSKKQSEKPAYKESGSSKQPSLKPQNSLPDIINHSVNVKNGKTAIKNNRTVQAPRHRTHVDLFRRNKSYKPLKNSTLTREKMAKDSSISSKFSNTKTDTKNPKKVSTFFPYQPTPRKLSWKVFILFASLSLIVTINRDLDLTKLKKNIAYFFIMGPNLKTLPLAVAK